MRKCTKHSLSMIILVVALMLCVSSEINTAMADSAMKSFETDQIQEEKCTEQEIAALGYSRLHPVLELGLPPELFANINDLDSLLESIVRLGTLRTREVLQDGNLHFVWPKLLLAIATMGRSEEWESVLIDFLGEFDFRNKSDVEDYLDCVINKRMAFIALGCVGSDRARRLLAGAKSFDGAVNEYGSGYFPGLEKSEPLKFLKLVRSIFRQPMIQGLLLLEDEVVLAEVFKELSVQRDEACARGDGDVLSLWYSEDFDDMKLLNSYYLYIEVATAQKFIQLHGKELFLRTLFDETYSKVAKKYNEDFMCSP